MPPASTCNPQHSAIPPAQKLASIIGITWDEIGVDLQQRLMKEHFDRDRTSS
jgi:hypothetical protein